MVLTIEDVIKLKTEVKNAFGVSVSFHDACGGQSFSLDKTQNGVYDFIERFVVARGGVASFSHDGLSFVVKRDKSL